MGFYEGFNLDRPCLYETPPQIDASRYTHLLFAFGTLSSDYKVLTGHNKTTWMFDDFKDLNGPKRILSIGGWAFSTDPSTYSIFRDGTKPANRETMAKNIADFITSYGLDGVNIDWEYPGVCIPSVWILVTLCINFCPLTRLSW